MEIKKEDKTSEINSLLNRLYPLFENDYELLKGVVKFLEKRENPLLKKDCIPISIFRNDNLTVYEAITKFLRENVRLKYAEIAKILNKKHGPIGVVYRNARKKMNVPLDISSQEYSIPWSVLSIKKLTIFEVIVFYLKENYGLSFNKISSLLNRNYRTVWAIYKSAKKKT